MLNAYGVWSWSKCVDNFGMVITNWLIGIHMITWIKMIYDLDGWERYTIIYYLKWNVMVQCILYCINIVF